MPSRRAVLLLIMLVLAPALAGCTATPPDADVLATFYPLRFLAAEIAGDNVSVGSVVKEGTEPHDWEPSPRDIARIGRSQLVIAQGLDFEPWLDGALRSLGRDAPPVQHTAEGLDAGHEPWDHEHDDEHEDGHGDQTGAGGNGTSGNGTTDGVATAALSRVSRTHFVEGALDARLGPDDHGDGHGHDHGDVDPHTWLDPVLFAQQAERVRDALILVFPEHEAAFRARADDLLHALEALHEEAETRLADCGIDVIVTQHDAYSRLAARYGFTVVSVSGLDPEAEADARRISDAIRTVRENSIPIVFTEPGGRDRVMDQIADETGAQVAVLHHLEGRTHRERTAGSTYLDLMHQNLDHLEQAMRCT